MSAADLQDLAAGTYYIQATHNTYLCESLQTPFVIDESNIYPTVTGESITQNSSCTTTGNGSITVTLAPASHSFTVDWKDGKLPTDPATTGTPTDNGANVFTLSDLSARFYTGVVTDNTSGCTMNFTYELGDSLRYPVINIPADQVTNNTLCTLPNNGAITIDDNDVSIAGTQPGTAAFTWTYSNSDFSVNNVVLTNTSPITLTDLTADTYTIIATSANGCASASFNVTILDNSQAPVIDSLYVNPDANCSGTIALGEIEIISLDGNIPPTANYVYQWYEGASATPGQEASASTNPLLTGVVDTTLELKICQEVYIP